MSKWRIVGVLCVVGVSVVGCGGESGGGEGGGGSGGGGSAAEGVDPALFVNQGHPLTFQTDVACELSDGTTTTCLTITSQSLPDHAVGPFCDGGIWLGEEIHSEAHECTLEGKVEGCLECAVEAHQVTWTLPAKPVPAQATHSLAEAMSRAGAVGVALNGVSIFLPDPEQKLISENNQAPVDPCGGHAGFQNDYHYHRVPSCLVDDAPGAHSPQIGYALDGYPLYGRYGEDGSPPADLDECQGHAHGSIGYHYHAIDAFPYFVACFRGELGKGSGTAPGGGAPGAP